MNIFEQFLNKISHKFPKGYPDMNNEQDISLLENLVSEVLGEAFTIFPKSEDEIINPKIKQLFNIIKSYPGLSIDDPLVLDPDSPNTAKITRALQRDNKFIEFLSKKLNTKIDGLNGGKWEGLSIKWGEGSRGGRGVKSKGLGFEDELYADLETLRDEDINQSNLDKFKYPNLIIEIAKELGLEQDNFTIVKESDKNQSRPLAFDGGGPVIKFSNETAAATLTDITITKGSTNYYLSAKFGNTLTFFNSGITKVLPTDEIKSGEIKNQDGKALLATLGIDNKTFCKVFNDYPDADFSKLNGPTSKYDSAKLKNLIKSGIGEGYYMVKAGGKGGYEFSKIDSKYANLASDVTGPVSVYYGGLGGNGKRIDVVVESALYKFKINIRNKQGGLYPSHIMCDYVKK
jgi:hypothetical protein